MVKRPANRFKFQLALLIFGLVFLTLFLRWQKNASGIWSRNEDRPTLVVLAYDDFVNSQGPGVLLNRRFEETCQCRVQLIRVPEAGLILNQLKTLNKNNIVDVVIGLDQLSLMQAKNEFTWRELNFDKKDWDPQIKPFVNREFIPFDWAPLTFIYREGDLSAPLHPRDLLDSRFIKSLSLSDPRTSSTGLQFLSGLSQWFKPDEFIKTVQMLKPNLLALSSNWSMAYSLFQRGQAKIVFSYQTSLIYHWTIEKDFHYKSADFNEGHPFQIEYAGVLKTCRNCQIAENFLHFLLDLDSQKLIMNKNYMFPAMLTARKGSLFAKLPELKLLKDNSEKFSGQREQWLKKWKDAIN